MIKDPRKYSIKDVFKIINIEANWNAKPIRVLFDGDYVKTNSLRLQLFKLKGTECVKCRIKGVYFKKVKMPDSKFFHLNLYALYRGSEKVMTKDHIIPKSRGGKDNYKNLQVMCEHCNGRKADKVDWR